MAESLPSTIESRIEYKPPLPDYVKMSRAYDLFRPNGLKLVLAGTLLVPGFFLLVPVNGFPYNDLSFPAVMTMVICYVAACVIDDAIKSRPVKIAIASAAALVSLILGSILVWSMTMVCDLSMIPV